MDLISGKLVPLLAPARRALRMADNLQGNERVPPTTRELYRTTRAEYDQRHDSGRRQWVQSSGCSFAHVCRTVRGANARGFEYGLSRHDLGG